MKTRPKQQQQQQNKRQRKNEHRTKVHDAPVAVEPMTRKRSSHRSTTVSATATATVTSPSPLQSKSSPLKTGTPTRTKARPIRKSPTATATATAITNTRKSANTNTNTNTSPMSLRSLSTRKRIKYPSQRLWESLQDPRSPSVVRNPRTVDTHTTILRQKRKTMDGEGDKDTPSQPPKKRIRRRRSLVVPVSNQVMDQESIFCCLCTCTIDYSDKELFPHLDPKLFHAKTKRENECTVEKECTVISLEKEELKEEFHQQNDSNNTILIMNQDPNQTQQQLQEQEENGNQHKDTQSISLPNNLYDAQNGILICDFPGCNRSYHQRCHFVPVLSIPKGAWFCLICRFKMEMQKRSSHGLQQKKDTNLLTEQPTNTLDHMTHSSLLGQHSIPTPMLIQNLDTLFRSNDTNVSNLHQDQDHPNHIPCTTSLTPSTTTNTTITTTTTTTTTTSSSPSLETNPRQPSTQLHPLDETSQLLREAFEFQSSHLKAIMLHQELSKTLKNTIEHHINKIRRAKDTIRTYTSTRSIQKTLMDDYLKRGHLPAELIQSISQMAESKLKIREKFLSLEKIISNYDEISILSNIPNMHWSHYFRRNKIERRKEPRFDMSDYDADECDDNDLNHVDDDPTQRIQCCVCFSGQVGIKNDILMCDGIHCQRAFHMMCITPHVSQQAIDDDIDGTWFCPYCTAFAHLLHDTRVEYLGDDDPSENISFFSIIPTENAKNQDSDSTASWEKAEDVFPEAEIEKSIAEQLRLRRRSTLSDKYFTSLLGIHGIDASITVESEHSSSLTTDESGIAQQISRHSDESDLDTSFSQESKPVSFNGSIGSKRTKAQNLETIDKSNIISGKRRRAKVDYRRLNEMLSGSDTEGS